MLLAVVGGLSIALGVVVAVGANLWARGLSRQPRPSLTRHEQTDAIDAFSQRVSYISTYRTWLRAAMAAIVVGVGLLIAAALL